MNNFKKTIIRTTSDGASDSLPDNLHPVLRRVYANRNLTDGADLKRTLKQLFPVSLLGGTEPAATLLEKMFRLGGKILVVADFDADGATSCALAVRALREMGATDVGYLVPNRFEYGYGLTPEIVAEALQQQPQLLITVDNGISSLQGVAAAKAAGVAVLITDHHLPGRELPAADVIVNPNVHDDAFPSKHLAGVGVIFYVMAALRSRLRATGWFGQQGLQVPNLARLLDLVALGTVADVVPLDRNNRILVHQGLQRIRAGQCGEGIRALVGVAGRNLQRLVSSDLGFAVGPRLNAAGRLDDMSIGIECLLSDDPDQARELAASLDGLNRERREIEQGMQQQALTDLESALPGGDLPYGLCLLRDDWHQGVIGLVAARVRERFHRPVIAFAPGEKEGTIKGSARSIPGLHIRDTLDAVATARPGLLEKFGGHAMAAGMSLKQADFEPFAQAFDAEVRRRVDEESLQGKVYSDGPLRSDEFSMELAELLRSSGPWGQGFPEPLFDGRFRVISQRILGQRHLKMVLEPEDGNALLDAIAFNQAERIPKGGDPVIHATYRLDVNEFRGERNLQLMVEYFSDCSV